MVSILAHAQNLVYTLLSLMPSIYQQENLEAPNAESVPPGLSTEY
jgi:hypothetical protein